jgi:hypothetical protein
LIQIVADPAALSGQIESYDCAENKIFPSGAMVSVNSPYSNCLCSVPVESMTWGGVKALYR